MNEFMERQMKLTWRPPRKSCDVAIVGAGGHGLATAYYLATRHGMTNVAVFERGYIGGGNSGRNTTIIRANYGIPAAVRFYQRSLDLYRGLEEETGRWLMHQDRGLLWMAHSEEAVRAERMRARLNTEFGARTEFVEPQGIRELCPEIDIEGGGRWPVLGASWHRQGATARHDRVVWALAEGAMERGVRVHQNTAVEGLILDGERVAGVRTAAGDVAAGAVVSAVGGHVSRLAAMAGLRLPIRTHRLQAFVTNRYGRLLGPIVASSELFFYASQTARGEMLLGAEIDPQPSFAYRSSHDFVAPTSRRSWGEPAFPVSTSRPAGAPGASRRSRPAVSRWRSLSPPARRRS